MQMYGCVIMQPIKCTIEIPRYIFIFIFLNKKNFINSYTTPIEIAI